MKTISKKRAEFRAYVSGFMAGALGELARSLTPWVRRWQAQGQATCKLQLSLLMLVLLALLALSVRFSSGLGLAALGRVNAPQGLGENVALQPRAVQPYGAHLVLREGVYLRQGQAGPSLDLAVNFLPVLSTKSIVN